LRWLGATRSHNRLTSEQSVPPHCVCVDHIGSFHECIAARIILYRKRAAFPSLFRLDCGTFLDVPRPHLIDCGPCGRQPKSAGTTTPSFSVLPSLSHCETAFSPRSIGLDRVVDMLLLPYNNRTNSSRTLYVGSCCDHLR